MLLYEHMITYIDITFGVRIWQKSLKNHMTEWVCKWPMKLVRRDQCTNLINQTKTVPAIPLLACAANNVTSRFLNMWAGLSAAFPQQCWPMAGTSYSMKWWRDFFRDKCRCNRSIAGRWMKVISERTCPWQHNMLERLSNPHQLINETYY